MMARVSVNVPAPDFALHNFKGEMVHLSDYRR